MKFILRSRIYLCFVLLSGCGYVLDLETFTFVEGSYWTPAISQPVTEATEERPSNNDPVRPNRDRPSPQPTSDDNNNTDPSSSGNSSPTVPDDDGPDVVSPPGDSGGGTIGGATDPAGQPNAPDDDGGGVLGGGIDPTGFDPNNGPLGGLLQ